MRILFGLFFEHQVTHSIHQKKFLANHYVILKLYYTNSFFSFLFFFLFILSNLYKKTKKKNWLETNALILKKVCHFFTIMVTFVKTVVTAIC